MVDRDVTISRLILQNDLLRSEVAALEQTVARLQKELGQLGADNQRLQEKLGTHPI
jgi:uncharacterized protein involved in exopolysaccharide biosynthesis